MLDQIKLAIRYKNEIFDKEIIIEESRRIYVKNSDM